MKAVTDPSQATLVNVIDLDPYFCRIMTDATRAFDLENEAYASGTRVGHYAYGSSVSAGHRNWQLMPLPIDVEDGLADVDVEVDVNVDVPSAIYDLSGRRVGKPTRAGVYIIGNRKVLVR